MFLNQQASHLVIFFAFPIAFVLLSLFWLFSCRLRRRRRAARLFKLELLFGLPTVIVTLFYLMKLGADLHNATQRLPFGGVRMSSSFAVVVPCFTRAHYLDRVLKGLEANPNFASTIVILSQDGTDPDVTELLDQFTSKHSKQVRWIRHARQPLALLGFCHRTFAEAGTSDHMRFVIDLAFRWLDVDCVSVLEDDIWPSPDFYAFSEFACRAAKKNSDSVLLVNAHHHDSSSAINADSLHVLERTSFAPRGWIVARESWNVNLEPRWTLFGGWDIQINKRVVPSLQNKAVFGPLISRTRHIGAKGVNYEMSQEEYERSLEAKVVTPDKSLTNPQTDAKLIF